MTWKHLIIALMLAPVGACTSRRTASGDSAKRADSAFAQVQMRGQHVMGVDQYTSKHVFEDLPDGGRIVLDAAASDTAGVRTIRTHMNEIAADFRRGDFTKPFAVHDRAVPGTDVMAARASLLSYDVTDRPRGAEVRIVTHDSAALAAVRRFLAFQREDHRAAGSEDGMDHMHMDHASHADTTKQP